MTELVGKSNNYDPKNEYVYCTECKHFRCIDGELYCSHADKCSFYDPEDSRPRSERPYWTPVVTNSEFIRREFNDKRLAHSLIKSRQETLTVFDMGGAEWCKSLVERWYTSDEERFDNYEEALAHEIQWLKEPIDNAMNEPVKCTDCAFFELRDSKPMCRFSVRCSGMSCDFDNPEIPLKRCNRPCWVSNKL